MTTIHVRSKEVKNESELTSLAQCAKWMHLDLYFLFMLGLFIDTPCLPVKYIG